MYIRAVRCCYYITPQVAELIAGLQEIGCTRTTGEDQTVCVISNSFNADGTASSLQASGDLPPVEVLKVREKKGNPVAFAACLYHRLPVIDGRRDRKTTHFHAEKHLLVFGLFN